MNSSDLTDALEALRITNIPWEGVLVDMDCGTGTVAVVDTWLSAREAEGNYHYALLNTRSKNKPAPSAESESTYATAMTAIAEVSASARVGVGTDGANMTSLVTGLYMWRPTSLFTAGRLAKIAVGTDAAYVADGPLTGATIAASTGNPQWHDEMLYPGLDAQRLITVRTVPGKQGVFINNANTIASTGSDYVFMQHLRTMNQACMTAFDVLTTQLGRGVGKKEADPTTGLVYIREEDASLIDGLVNDALATPLKGQVSSYAFALSRTDDLSANSGATIHAELQVEGLGYIKGFAVNAKFVKTISVNI